MNESLPLFPCSFWPIIFWFVHISLTPPEGSNHSVVWQLRLYTHPRWLPHQCQTYTRCSTIIICCGCAYEWVLTMLQLLSSATSFGTHLPRIMDTSLGAKHSAVMCWWGYTHSRCPPHQCQTYESCFRMSSCCGCAYGWVLTMLLPLLLLTKRLEVFLKSGSLPGVRPQRNELVEAINPLNMAPTSIWNI